VFGVAVRSRSEPDDLTHVRRLCDRAVELGFRVRRIVLATGRVRERDLEATARLGLDATELVSSDDLDDISRAIGECTAFASMKFQGSWRGPCTACRRSPSCRPTRRATSCPGSTGRICSPSTATRTCGAPPDRPRPDLGGDRDRLRADAVAHLADLRAAIGAAVGG
jgi:hypothetical protein